MFRHYDTASESSGVRRGSAARIHGLSADRPCHGEHREQSYTNAYEAMVINYEKGTRVFEIDLMLTEDRKVVARHEWTKSMTQQLGQKEKLPDDKQAARLSHEEFINTPILELYQPMDIEGLWI